MSDRLLELAERLEKATGPDRSLEIDIFAAVMGLDPMIALGEKPFYTRSLDAAMTLVPEGFVWGMGGPEEGRYWAIVAPTGEASAEPIGAATAALALCAAALRAKAQEQSHDRP
jgi:hypothetical protein